MIRTLTLVYLLWGNQWAQKETAEVEEKSAWAGLQGHWKFRVKELTEIALWKTETHVFIKKAASLKTTSWIWNEAIWSYLNSILWAQLKETGQKFGMQLTRVLSLVLSSAECCNVLWSERRTYIEAQGAVKWLIWGNVVDKSEEPFSQRARKCM